MLHLDLRPLAGSLLLLSPLGLALPAAAEVWRSPLHEKTYLQVEKRLDGSPGIDGTAAFAPLPGDLVARLRGDLIEYESFVAAYLSAADAASVAADLAAADWRFQLGIDRRVELPWHSFEAGDAKGRTSDFAATGLTARPLSELYLLQFAYPVLEKWLDEVEGCGLKRLATLQQRTILVRARGLAEILGCPAARYLSWIDSYRSTDRVPPAMLMEEAPLGYTLHFAPGTDLGVWGGWARPGRLPLRLGDQPPLATGCSAAPTRDVGEHHTNSCSSRGLCGLLSHGPRHRRRSRLHRQQQLQQPQS